MKGLWWKKAGGESRFTEVEKRAIRNHREERFTLLHSGNCRWDSPLKMSPKNPQKHPQEKVLNIYQARKHKTSL